MCFLQTIVTLKAKKHDPWSHDPHKTFMWGRWIYGFEYICFVFTVVLVWGLQEGLFSTWKPEDPPAQPHGGETLSVSAPRMPQGFQQLQWQSQTPAHTPGHSEWHLSRRTCIIIMNNFFLFLRSFSIHFCILCRSRTRARFLAVESVTLIPVH